MDEICFLSSSLIPLFDKEITIHQFIWDKYECIHGKYSGNFIKLLQENINNEFKKNKKAHVNVPR